MSEEDFGPLCPSCGCDLEWEECGRCGGEGWIDVYDDDPLWYDPGDMSPCLQCGGHGGWWVCPDYVNHPMHQDKQVDARRVDQ